MNLRTNTNKWRVWQTDSPTCDNNIQKPGRHFNDQGKLTITVQVSNQSLSNQ